MKIGVFDSGIGGLSVAKALERAFPDASVLFINDVDHLPYGSKTPTELSALAMPHLHYLENQGCDLIVVACNTLSTTVVPDIYESFPIPIVGIVPMIRPASAATKTGIIAVCATPTTLGSKRYAELKKLYATDVVVLEPFCGNWAQMIESNTVDNRQIRETIEHVCQEGADVIVLGCTHYHWIEDIITEIADGRAAVMQPEDAVVEQVRRLITNRTKN
jgi:glutamate racemase